MPHILNGFIRSTHVAYFTMEIALRNEMHTYSGGLGVLAGDMARSCADLRIPVVFVSLVSRKGYLRQEIGQQGQQLGLGCCRFRGHRVRCQHGTGGGSWNDGSLRESSSLRRYG